MRAWEIDLFYAVMRALLWGLGMAAAWVTVCPQLGWPRALVALRRWKRLRPLVSYRVLRGLALGYLLALVPYGGLLAVEMLTGSLTDSAAVRDWLLAQGYSISYFEDRLMDWRFRLFAWVTLCGVLPLVFIWFFGAAGARRRFLLRAAILEQDRGAYRCVHCDYDRGAPAEDSAPCPECGGPWRLSRAQRMHDD